MTEHLSPQKQKSKFQSPRGTYIKIGTCRTIVKTKHRRKD